MTKAKQDNTQAGNESVNQPIKLQHPYKTDAGVPIEQVNVRGITVREMKNAQRVGDGDEISTNYAMVATACDLVQEDLDKMMAIDFQAVQNRFLKLNIGDSQ